ncbi:hypothetical protein GGF32_005530 [Allomyces javanicus]|nr:hypothetical protein GGF32_005530 [Allomyces javanicus]
MSPINIAITPYLCVQTSRPRDPYGTPAPVASDLTETNRQLRATSVPVTSPDDQAADEFLASLGPAVPAILPPPRPATAPPMPPLAPLATTPIPAHIPHLPLADLVAELARKTDKAALNHQAKLQHAMLDLTAVKAHAVDLVEKVGNLRNVLVSGMDGAHQALCTKLDHATETLLDAIVNAQLPPPPPALPAPDLDALAIRMEQYMDARLARLEAAMAARLGSTVGTRLDRIEASVLAQRDPAAAPSPPTGKNAGKRRSPAGVQTNPRLFTVERQAQTVLTGRGPTVPVQSKKVGTIMDDACPNCGLYEHARANCPYPPHECHACGCHGHQIYFCPHVSLLGRARNKKYRKRVEAAEALMLGAAAATAAAAVAVGAAQTQVDDDENEDVDVEDMDLDDPEGVSSLTSSSSFTSSSVGVPLPGPGAVTAPVAAPATIPASAAVSTAAPFVHALPPSTVRPMPMAPSTMTAAPPTRSLAVAATHVSTQALEPLLPPPPPPAPTARTPLPMPEIDPMSVQPVPDTVVITLLPHRATRGRRGGAGRARSPPASPTTTFVASPARSPPASPTTTLSARMHALPETASSPGLPSRATSPTAAHSPRLETALLGSQPVNPPRARQEHAVAPTPPAPPPPAHPPISAAAPAAPPAVPITVEVQDKGGERTFTMNPESLF